MRKSRQKLSKIHLIMQRTRAPVESELGFELGVSESQQLARMQNRASMSVIIEKVGMCRVLAEERVDCADWS
jgi:hypothetical protein